MAPFIDPAVKNGLRLAYQCVHVFHFGISCSFLESFLREFKRSANVVTLHTLQRWVASENLSAKFASDEFLAYLERWIQFLGRATYRPALEKIELYGLGRSRGRSLGKKVFDELLRTPPFKVLTLGKGERITILVFAVLLVAAILSVTGNSSIGGLLLVVSYGLLVWLYRLGGRSVWSLVRETIGGLAGCALVFLGMCFLVALFGEMDITQGGTEIGSVSQAGGWFFALRGFFR